MDKITEILFEKILDNLTEKVSAAHVISHPELGELRVTKTGTKTVDLGKDDDGTQRNGKLTTYDIHHKGVKVGELQSHTGSYDVMYHGQVFGKTLPELTNYSDKGTGLPGAFQRFTETATGKKFMGSVIKKNPDLKKS